MVGKLYRHEASALARVMLPISAICLLIAGLFRLSVEVGLLDSEILAIKLFIGILIAANVFAILAVVIISFVLVIVRFYKHFFTGEGYLTMTLPVNTSAHIICKTVCGLAAQLFSVIVATAALYIIGGLLPTPVDVFNAAKELFAEMKTTFGATSATLMLVELVLLIVLSALQKNMQAYAALALGQRSSKRKIVMSVVWYVVFTVGIEIASIFIAAGTASLDSVINVNAYDYSSIGNLTHGLLVSVLVFEAILTTVFYLITYFNMKKKLNLE